MAKRYLMPYTNLHELNLDWLINAMKQLESQWDSYGTELTATVESLPSGSKAEVEVTGSLKDKMNMAFKLPSGDKGADGSNGTTYYPEVSKDGVISWSNDGGKVNPTSVNIKGPQGAQGPAGSGLFILDTYETLEELKAAHPTGISGNAYLIGTAPNFMMYIWSISKSEWVNAGSIAAPSPSTSVPLQDADVGSTGVENAYARGDHAHPHDDSKLDKASSDETAVYGVSGSDQILFPFSTFATTSELEQKQDKLVSGTNIKTINNTALLGEGNISVGADLNLELLWENSSTSTAFSAQTITLNLSSYKLFLLLFKRYIGDDGAQQIVVGKGYNMIMSDAAYKIIFRNFELTDISIIFQDNLIESTYGSNYSTDNDYMLPYKIYGIRTGGTL